MKFILKNKETGEYYSYIHGSVLDIYSAFVYNNNSYNIPEFIASESRWKSISYEKEIRKIKLNKIYDL